MVLWVQTRFDTYLSAFAEKVSFGYVGLYVKEMLIMHHVPLLVVPSPESPALCKHSRYYSTRLRELHFLASSPVCKAGTGIRSACDLLLHENLPSFSTLNILGRSIVQGQKVLTDTMSAGWVGKSLWGKCFT